MTEKNPVLVEICRGDLVESTHHGAVAVVDSGGKIIWSAGDIKRLVYPRSALKMFQALPVVMSGITAELKLSGEDHALLLASHSGEERHTKRVATMLEKMDLTMADLECGIHAPYHHGTSIDLEKKGLTACPLHNNCSGKHSGMLMLARAMKETEKNYINPTHRVQREIAKLIEKFCDIALPPPAVDGCSAPTFALPLYNMALGLAKFGVAAGDEQQGCDKLLTAAMENPFYVAGSGRYCTKVMETMQQAGQKVFVKVGAEGVYAAILPTLGIGVAIKIDDGGERAVQLTLAAVLKKLGVATGDILPTEKPIKSHQRLPAGTARTSKIFEKN